MSDSTLRTATDVPAWLRVAVHTSALLGGSFTLLIGVLIFAIRLTPDTSHGEDIGVPIAIALLLPAFLLSALMGVGAGIGGLPLSAGRTRMVPALAVVLTLLGLLLGVAAYLGIGAQGI